MDTWLDTIRLLPYSIYLKWMMLLIPAGMLFYWQRNSYRAFLPYLDHPSAETQNALFNISTMRGWIILGLWGMLSMTLITYDLRYPVRDKEDAGKPAPTIAQPTPSDTQTLLQAPGISRTPEAYLDLLKSRYEDAFLSFFYLRQCKVSKDEDYQQLYINFKRQLSAAGADESMVENTVSAALGSFETIYSGAPCDAKYLNPIQERFRQMLAALGASISSSNPPIN